jgi:hypothetical protein
VVVPGIGELKIAITIKSTQRGILVNISKEERKAEVQINTKM